MEFTSRTLAQLHRGLLVSALRALAGGDRQTRSEILHWIFAGDDQAQGESAAPPQGELPFSFGRCCEHAGVDAARMRERLLRILARLGMPTDAAAPQVGQPGG